MADKDTKAPKYVAFISYQRKDEEMARWFHRQLEHYHLPTDLNDGDIGGIDDQLRNMKSLRPMFLDEAELAGGSLSGAIDSALNNSRFLIVLCSPNSAKSQWVNKEVQAFVDNKRVSQIIPVIIDGIPYSGDEQTECFVPALLELKGSDDERIGINAMAGREMASVKVVSQILGVSFDSLWNRYEREKEEERQRMIEEKRRLQRLESRYLAEKAKDAIAEGNSYLARKLALRALPEDIYNVDDRPFVGEASDVLYHSLFSDNAIIAKDLSGNISCAVFCPDNVLDTLFGKDAQNGSVAEVLSGKIVATCGAYSTGVAFWDVSSGVKIKEIPFETTFYHISFSPDGKKLVGVGHYDICLYSLEQGWKKEVERPDFSLSCSAEFSRCGKYLACVCKDGGCDDDNDDDYVQEQHYVVLYDAGNLVELRRFEGHLDNVNSLVFSVKGTHLLTCSDDRTIRWWNIATGECDQVLNVKYKIKHIALNADGTKLMAALRAKVILLWDFNDSKQPKVFKGHGHTVLSAHFCYDEKMIISVSYDNTVKLWDISSGECVRTISSDTALRCASLSPNGRYIVSGVDMRIIDMEGSGFLGNKSVSVDTKKMGSPRLAFCHKSKTIYYSSVVRESDDLEIFRWNLESGSVEKIAISSHKPEIDEAGIRALMLMAGNVNGMYVSPDDKYLAVDVDKDDLYILETSTGKVVKKISFEGGKHRTIFPVNNCCQLFVLALPNAYLMDFATLAGPMLFNAIDIRRSKIRALWGNGEKVFLGYEVNDEETVHEFLLYEYDVLKNEIVNETHIPLSGSLNVVRNTSDYKKLVVVTDENLRIWDIEKGSYVATLPVRLSGDNFFDFSPDLRFIISSQGKSVHHIDFKTGQCFYSKTYEGNKAGNVFFSPDGSMCASSSPEGLITVWDFMEPDRLIRQIRAVYADCGLSEMEKKAHYLE